MHIQNYFGSILPQDMQKLVFAHVIPTSSTTIKTLSLVCREWNSILKSPEFITLLNVSAWTKQSMATCQDTLLEDVWEDDFEERQKRVKEAFAKFMRWLNVIPDNFRQLITTVDLTGQDISSEERGKILAKLPKLTSITLDGKNLSNENVITPEEISQILSLYPFESLTLRNITIRAEQLSPLPKTLKRLELRDCPEISFEIFKALEPIAPQLAQLSLRGCYQVTECGFTGFVDQAKALEIIDLSDCAGFSENSLKNLIGKCLTLKEMRMFSQTGITERLAEAIKGKLHLDLEDKPL